MAYDRLAGTSGPGAPEVPLHVQLFFKVQRRTIARIRYYITPLNFRPLIAGRDSSVSIVTTLETGLTSDLNRFLVRALNFHFLSSISRPATWLAHPLFHTVVEFLSSR